MAKSCPKCHMTLENNLKGCLCLPEGKTCGHCGHFKRCGWLVGAKKEQSFCDWYPVIFEEGANGADEIQRFICRPRLEI